jgi:protein-S-isoprenylcysteine O-methyltransferase Ste14
VRLADHHLRAGHRLFRWRSYVPLMFLPAFALALAERGRPFSSHTATLAWQCVCLIVSLLGVATRVLVVGHAAAGTSGRNQAEQKADSLNTTGLYSVVRHPLYLGNALMFIGLAMLPGVWWLPVIVALGTALYYERIMLVEEAYLDERYGVAFREWAAHTPAIFPQWSGWVRAALPFDWRIPLRAEIYGLFAVCTVLFVVDLIGSWIATGRPDPSPLWTGVTIVMAVLWIVLRAMRKNTGLLNSNR